MLATSVPASGRHVPCHPARVYIRAASLLRQGIPPCLFPAFAPLSKYARLQLAERSPQALEMGRWAAPLALNGPAFAQGLRRLQPGLGRV